MKGQGPLTGNETSSRGKSPPQCANRKDIREINTPFSLSSCLQKPLSAFCWQIPGGSLSAKEPIDTGHRGQTCRVEEGAEWICQGQQKTPRAPPFLPVTITESKGAQIPGNYRFFRIKISPVGDSIYCITLI